MAKNELTKKPQTTDLALPEPMTVAVRKLDKCASDLEVVANQPPSFEQNMLLALAIKNIRHSLFEKIHEGRSLIDYIMVLQGTPLGFAADKKYNREQCADITIQAAAHGARMVGKEVTAISGNAYLNQNFFTRMQKELEANGLLEMSEPLEFEITGDGPMPGTKVVEVHYKFRFEGKPEERVRKVYVRINGGQGPDAAIGKAKRKALCWLYEYVTGRKVEDIAEDVPEMSAREYRPPSPLERPQVVRPGPAADLEPVDFFEAQEQEPAPAPEPEKAAPTVIEDVVGAMMDKVSEEDVNAFLRSHMRWINSKQTWRDLAKAQKDMVVSSPGQFLGKVVDYREAHNG